ncbi:MAG: hypothetical protein HPY44_07495 [Armatimonadetes bacterium]|nr:hypothetical protein [Armatimonadota bacterium]
MHLKTGFTWRAVVVGVAACVFIADWSQYSELIIHGTQISLTYPPIGGFIVFLALYAFFNVILKAMRRSWALSQPEWLIVFTMIVLASGIASIDLAQKLIPMIAGPQYYCTNEKAYSEPFLSTIPEWMAPTDSRVVKGLFEGWGYGVPWREWLVPLGAWTAFTLASYVLMQSLIAIFRRQWVENERLLFPLAAVPFEIIEEPRAGRFLNTFFRNRIMWIGLVGAFLLHFYNGLHAYFATLPEIEVATLMGKPQPTYSWGRPWNAIGTVYFAFHPIIIGLSFLLTREVSFSLWAFYWIARAEAVLGYSLGLDGMSIAAGGDRFPFPGHQTAGAYLALAGVSIWLARRPLWEIVRKGLTFQPGDDAGEPMSYRGAVWAGLISFAFMVGWCVYAGMVAWVAVLVLVIAFGYTLAMTRLVSEAGMPWMAEPDWRAHDIIRALVPFNALPQTTWSAVTMLMAFTHDMRVSPMPRIMQSMKIADQSGAATQQLTWALLIAAVVTIPVSYWSLLEAGYTHGGVAINVYRFVSLARAPDQFMNQLTAGLVKHTDWLSMGLVGYGAAKLIALSFLRMNYLWWPLHPVGYAMSYIVYLPREWLSVFIGWLCQTLLMRYGGFNSFSRYRPLFLGMVVGAILAAGVWLFIDGATGLRDHKLLY